jgi:hypothetical protein
MITGFAFGGNTGAKPPPTEMNAEAPMSLSVKPSIIVVLIEVLL